MLSTIRHHDVFNASKNNGPIHLIGAGAIGSRIWTALVELGLTDLHVYDFDQIESHNLANQIYFNSQIGMPKVDGLREWTKWKLGYVPQTYSFNSVKVETSKPYDPSPAPLLEDTVIMAVDSIEARRDIISYITTLDCPVAHCFDTRMASTHGNIVYVNPMNPIDTAKYLDALPDDETTELSACGTSMSVGTTATIIANMAVWQMMHSRQDPAAQDKFIELYLQPLTLHLGTVQ